MTRSNNDKSKYSIMSHKIEYNYKNITVDSFKIIKAIFIS